MSLLYLIFGLFLVALLPHGSEATALTYNIEANEKACFYNWVDKPGKKLGFYFAVNKKEKKRKKKTVYMIILFRESILIYTNKYLFLV